MKNYDFLTDFGSANICSCVEVEGMEREDLVEPGSSGDLLLFCRESGKINPSSACDFGERFLFAKYNELFDAHEENTDIIISYESDYLSF